MVCPIPSSPGKGMQVVLSGDFNRVILEFEVENVGGFEARLKDYGTNPAFREKMKGYTDLWATGSREILQTA